MAHASTRAIVVVDAKTTAEELGVGLRASGITATIFSDAKKAWRSYQANRAEMVLLDLDILSRGGDWFIRQLRDHLPSRDTPLYLFGAPSEVDPQLGAFAAAVLTLPMCGDSLRSLTLANSASPARQLELVQTLGQLTLLGIDLLPAIDALVMSAAEAFGADNCIMWGARHEPHWPRSAHPIGETTWVDDCELALLSQSTLVTASGHSGEKVITRGPSRSIIAAPLRPPGGNELGGIALIAESGSPFAPHELNILRQFAMRLSLELSWVSAHIRLAGEHERLRESALTDPLLKVWTRAALEASIQTEIAAASRRKEPLALAIIDVIQLRQVNERYGHPTGDAVLAHLSEVVRKCIRRQDHVGRFGGDELGVLLVGATIEGAKQALTNLTLSLENSPYKAGILEIPIEITVGITELRPCETSPEGAFARAISANRRARATHATIVLADSVDTGPQHGATDSDLATAGLPNGSTLGGMYRILHEISRGAMGIVYRAEDLGLGRPVAIKVLRSDLARDRGLVSQFREEAAMLASLRHRNVVNVYSFGSEGDEVYFVMELVEGESLKDMLLRLKAQHERLDLATLAKIVEQISDALGAIHSVGIIHRDVKPANILIDRINDRAVLVDVGVAKRGGERGEAAGTPGYAAPESFMDSPESTATDVYGLAATTYKALTGRAPFGGGQVEHVVRRQLSETPVRASVRRPDAPAAVDAVLLKGLHANLSQRYTNAKTFASAFIHALSVQTGEHFPDDVPTRVVRPHNVADESPVVTPVPRGTQPGTLVPETLSRFAHSSGSDTVTSARKPVPGHTRGAVFRVASKILTHRLGSQWVDRVGEEAPALRAILSSTLSPMSWHPVHLLIDLLSATSNRVRNPAELAHALGRSTMTATFARFFGADPSTLTPLALLKAAGSYWPRYHTWGQLYVTETGKHRATIAVAAAPAGSLIGALTAGSFTRIVELAGGREVHTTRASRLNNDDPTLLIDISWS